MSSGCLVALPPLRTRDRINLSQRGLKDSDLGALLGALSLNPYLKELDLHGNPAPARECVKTAMVVALPWTLLREHGTVESPLPARWFVPGDRVWFRNPDERSADAEGFEGSWYRAEVVQLESRLEEGKLSTKRVRVAIDELLEEGSPEDWVYTPPEAVWDGAEWREIGSGMEVGSPEGAGAGADAPASE
jgi:hypothetical protein